MTPEEETLRAATDILSRAGVPYMLTGSVAASYYGRPRSTHDSDIVIAPSSAPLEMVIADLASAAFYVDAAGARRALNHRSQFNAIHTPSACKIDLIVCKDREFSREEFDRRRTADLPFGRAISIVSPEDAVLSKLEWARQGGESRRQIEDAASVVRLTPGLDRAYIGRWAAALGVFDLWEQIAPTGLTR
jgi:regulator of extracellular matrix RemA (YlzA/DUF370 family)